MRSASLWFAAALVLTGCEDAWKDDHDFVWRGEDVTVYGYGHTEADACAGSLVELDGHTERIERDLGIEDGQRYTYRWLSYAAWDRLGEQFCAEHGACTTSGEVMSRLLPHMHEVVHAVTHRSGDGCPRVLGEGLAMYYDETASTSTVSPVWGQVSIREILVDGLGESSAEFGVALHFVSFLAQTYGPKSIVELCQALPIEPSMSTWDQAVRSVYGITLEQLLVEYQAYPKCNYEYMRARLWGCSGVVDYTFWVPEGEYVVESGCDDPKATNTAWGENMAVLSRRIRVFDDMKLRVSSIAVGYGPDPVHILRECAPCSEDPDVFVEITDDPYEYETRRYPAGTYEVTVVFDMRTNVRLSITAEDDL